MSRCKFQICSLRICFFSLRNFFRVKEVPFYLIGNWILNVNHKLFFLTQTLTCENKIWSMHVMEQLVCGFTLSFGLFTLIGPFWSKSHVTVSIFRHNTFKRIMIMIAILLVWWFLLTCNYDGFNCWWYGLV